jgi:FkbM family methyltransferase
MNATLTRLLHLSRIGLIPMKVRGGFLRGARWTLWPCSSYWRLEYEPEVQAALRRHAPAEGQVAWDLGAHFGFYSLWLARAVGPRGEVVAFEPDPTSHGRLRRHLALNPWACVRSFPCAVSEKDDTLRLIQNQGAGATTSHLAYHGEQASTGPVVEVATVSLDLLAAREHLRPPALIKIDVEGHAASALKGARDILARHHPRLLISLHSPEECTGVRGELESLGYCPVDLEDRPITWETALFKTVWYHANL